MANKTYNDVQINVKFTKATDRAELDPSATNGEHLAISLGKIAKWYDSLVPTGGSSGKFLGWNSSGTAKWVDAPTYEDKNMSQTLKTDNVNRPLLMSIESTSNTTATITTTGARNNSMYGNVSTGLIYCRGREISNFTLKTGSTAQSHITLDTLMTWLITSKKYIPSGKYCHVVLTTAWDYSNSDILQVSINSTNYEIQLAGVIIEFMGSATSYNAGTFRLLIHSSPTTSFTAATGYTKFPTATTAEYTCNGSSYSPVWKMILNVHPTITVSADTTSTASPAHGGTFTTVDSVTRDANGHVTKINTKTVTLPSDQNTDTKATQSSTTTTDYRPITLGAKNTTTVSQLDATVTDQVYTSQNFFVKPSSGTLYATEFMTKSYLTGTGADLAQYGLYLKSYLKRADNTEANYADYVVRTYNGKISSNDGLLLTVGGGGLTILGGGESAAALAGLISDDTTASGATTLNVGGNLNTTLYGNSERAIISSDDAIYFITNCQTIANRKPVCLDNNLYFYPGTNDTGSLGTSSYRWNSVYANVVYGVDHKTIGTSHGYYLKDSTGTEYGGVYDNGSNLWIGSTMSTNRHHKGQTYISTGWTGTLPTTSGGVLTGNSSILISVPKYTATSASAGTWDHTAYYALHSGNFTTTGSGNAVTSVAFDSSTQKLTFTKGSTFLTSHQSVSDKNVTLAWGTQKTIATIGSTDIHVTLPSNPNTNTTYTLGTSGNNVTLTPSSGSVQSITVPYATKANLLNYTHNNEINFSGGKQATCYFNYRDADTDAVDTGETPVSIDYRFCDYRNSTAYTTITAANFAGNASTATKWKTARTLTIGSTGKSVDGSGNVSWSLSEIGAAATSHTHDSLEMKALTSSTIDTTAGTFGFKGTGLLGNSSADWAGFQVDASNDRFQLTVNSQLLFRQNDESTMAGNWSAWVGCITPNHVSATSGIKVTKTTTSVGTGDGSLTYYSGVKIEHDVSTSADTTNSGTLSHGGTFTAITSVTRDSYGHVKTLNTKTYTLPGSGDTDTKVTQTAVGSTYTNYRPLVISASNANSAPPTATTVTDGTFITSSIYCQPSSGTVYASKFVGPLQGNADTATTATNAANVYGTVTNGTTTTTRYGVVFAADPNTSEYNTMRKTYDFRINLTNGATNTTGLAELVLGNEKAKNTADNKQGSLTLYSAGTSYHQIYAAETSSAIAHTLPATAGTILNTGTTSWTQTVASSATGAYQIGKIKINGTETVVYGVNTNTNTTYTLGASGDNVTLTPSSGSVQSITVPYATSSKEAYLRWGGRDFTDDCSPVDQAMVASLSPNRLELTRADGITIERSANTGSSWSAVTMTDGEKRMMTSIAGPSMKVTPTDTRGMNANAAKYLLRITLDASSGVIYSLVNKFVTKISTSGSSGCYVKIYRRTVENAASGTDTWQIWNKTSKSWVATTDSSATDANTKNYLGGWYGFNVINFTEFKIGTTANAGQYRNVRFVFGAEANNNPADSSHSVDTYGGMIVYNVLMYGGWGWGSPSNLANTGHLYSWDGDEKATFPAEIKVPTQMRIFAGSYGMIIRNDNTNTYFLPTAANDPQGSWRAPDSTYQFPLYINNSSGKVTMGNNVEIVGTLMLTKTTDAELGANKSPALIVGGTATTAHLELDSNEIMAKSNGTTGASLYLNSENGAGYVFINDGYAGHFTATPTSGQIVVTDGTTGGIKSSGYSTSSFLSSSTKYALSSSVGGAALSVSTQGGDVVLGTTGTSSNDSGDIVWKYGNGNEKMRIWTDPTYTAASGPKYRVYKEDGTLLYAGTLPLADGTGASGTWSINISGNAATATRTSYLDIVASNEIRFSVATKPGDATDIHIGHAWSNGTYDAKINSYIFKNGDAALAPIKAKAGYFYNSSVFNTRYSYVDYSGVHCTTPDSGGGGWASGIDFQGSSDFGGFGAFGTGDALTYYYMGGVYNDPAIKIERSSSGHITTFYSAEYNEIRVTTTKSGKASTSSVVKAYPLATTGQTLLFGGANNCGGNTVVGGGEACYTLYTNDYDSITTTERERLYLAADYDIYLITNAQAYSGINVLKIIGKSITSTYGGPWINARDNTIIYANKDAATGNSFYPIGTVKSNTGAWSIGGVATTNRLYFVYTTDTDYNASPKNNDNAKTVYIDENGVYSGSAASVVTQEANANANRVVFFADNSDTKKLVYDNDFKYNPSTNELTAQKLKGSLLRYHPSVDLSTASSDTTVSVTEYPSYTFSYVQTPAIFGGTDGRMGDSSGNWWAHYAVMSHGSGNSQYRYILRFPFWGAPQYQRPTATSSNERWRNFLTDETGAGGNYFLAYPADGYYYSHGNATGAIDITLPVGPGMMLSFSVDIWDYSAGKSCTYKIAGYGYAQDNKWYSTTAYCIGKPTHSMNIPVASSSGQTEITNLNVRFGYNSTSGKLKVQIGETDTSWSYLAVQIHDVTFCYGTTYFSTVSKGWSIGLVTSNIPNVTSTVKATNIAYHASAIALTHGNECNFTGPSSGTTNIWFGYRKADVNGTETNTAYISRYLFGNGNNSAVAGITCGDVIINTATTGTPTLSFVRGTTSDNYYDWRIRDDSGALWFDVNVSGTWTSRGWFPADVQQFTILGSVSLKNGSYEAKISPSSMTANRTFTLPNKSGGLPVSNILYENSTGTQAPTVAEAKGYKYFIVTVYHGTLGEQTAMITPNQTITDHCYFSWTHIDDSQAASLRIAGAHIKVEPASSTNSITFTVYISDRHIVAPGNASTITSTATSGTPVIRKIIGFM